MRLGACLGGVAIAIAVAAFSGCKGKNAENVPAVRSAVPQDQYKPVAGVYGGSLVLGSLGPPKSFNPITASETSTSEYTEQIYLGLTRQNPWTFAPEPELAVSWTPDESGLVWTVKLREGVTWSDGVPFTADDVLYTFEILYDTRWMAPMRDLLLGANGDPWKLEKVDDLTVKFTLPEKNAVFPLLLATSIIPKHKYRPYVEAGTLNEALGTSCDPAELVGTGPFLLDRYETGQKVVLKRNPRYYKLDAAGNRLPYLDSVQYLIVPNIDVLILNFRQGAIDVVGLRGQDFPLFAGPQKEKPSYAIYKLGPALGSEFLFFNQNEGVDAKTGRPYVDPEKLRLFRDTRFRQAVSHSIDRDFIVKSIMNGLGYPQYGPMNEASGFYFVNPNAPKYPYDPQKARALLAEIGLQDRNGDGVLEDANGKAIEIQLTTNMGNNIREQTAEVIRKDLEQLGLKVNYRPMDFNALVTKLDFTYDWEACVMGLTGGPEPHNGANVWKSSGHTHMWYPKQSTPSTKWEAEIDDLFNRGVAELDKENRREIYWRWQEIVGEQQPMIYTAAPESLVAVRDKFGNIFPARGGTLHNREEIFVKQ